MGRYRRKPADVEAVPVADIIRWAENEWHRLPGWIIAAYDKGDLVFMSDHVTIATLEGVMRGSKDDWMIEGVQGEVYPCKPDIFVQLYEPVATTGADA